MSADNDRYLIRATDGPIITDITPESAGWAFSGLTVLELQPGQPATRDLAKDEALVVPLSGPVSLLVTTPDGEQQVELAGRPSPFSGPADVAYLPVGSTVTLSAAGGASSRVAIGTARVDSGAEDEFGVQVLRASQAATGIRGAGSCSRQVTNYTIATEVGVHRLLACEVITPGGNWSSYPPHKHDEHSESERELEEIYYFEVTDGPAGPGMAYHRTYGTQQRPIDVLAEVRSGDTALVPHGYHGPCVAPPGHDLYYLNVMAGPAQGAQWLSTDDPHFAWIRETWDAQEPDPRLPFDRNEVTR